MSGARPRVAIALRVDESGATVARHPGGRRRPGVVHAHASSIADDSVSCSQVRKS